MTVDTRKKFRKDHKFKFTKEQLKKEIYEALMWTSNGLEMNVRGDNSKNSVPYIMGDVENLTVILTVLLTEGLPTEKDSPASTETSPATS